MPTTTGFATDLITFSRGSSATRVNASGFIETVGSNVARLDYDPSTLAAKGLLVEEQRTNLVLYSAEFDNAYWTKGAATITANAITAPDGTMTADKFSETSATAEHYLLPGAFALSAGSATASVFLKAAERTWANIYLSPNVVQYAHFNLADGTIGTVTAGVTASIQSVGNGWYRCSVSKTTVAANYSLVINTMTGNNSTEVYAGTSGSGIYIWGAQLEAGAFATSYIPTAAATVTRNADVAFVATSQFPYSATEGTLVVNVQPFETTNNASVVSLDASSAANHQAIYILPGATNRYAHRVRSGNVSQADYYIDTTGSTAGAVAKVAAAYKQNDFAGSKNGGEVQTDTVGSVPSAASTLRLSSYVGDSFTLNGYIRQITYIPRRLTNAELQARTA